MKRLAWFALLMLVALPILGHAQGCAMCYTAASQQSEAGKKALDAGILFLLMPALGMFCGVFYFAWRHRGGGGDPAAEERS
jgi:hypothetical protein